MELTPIRIPEIDPYEPGQAVQARVALAAAVKVLQVERSMGAALVSLLDPNLGKYIDARA